MKLQNSTYLIQALDILFHQGQVNSILDQHKNHLALGNKPRVTELDPKYHTHPKLPTLLNLLQGNKDNLLA